MKKLVPDHVLPIRLTSTNKVNGATQVGYFKSMMAAQSFINTQISNGAVGVDYMFQDLPKGLEAVTVWKPESVAMGAVCMMPVHRPTMMLTCKAFYLVKPDTHGSYPTIHWYNASLNLMAADNANQPEEDKCAKVEIWELSQETGNVLFQVLNTYIEMKRIDKVGPENVINYFIKKYASMFDNDLFSPEEGGDWLKDAQEAHDKEAKEALKKQQEDKETSEKMEATTVSLASHADLHYSKFIPNNTVYQAPAAEQQVVEVEAEIVDEGEPLPSGDPEF